MMRMWALLLAILLSCLSVPSSAQQTELRLVLGTATPGGGFPAYGEALVASLREVDPGLVLEPRATGGSAENLRLLREGALDLALVQGEFAYNALAAEPGNGSGLTVVAPMYPTPGLFVVPADSPVSGIADLRGRAVALGTRNSGLTAMGRSVLQASGVDPDRDVTPLYLERAGDGPGLVSEGRAAALWGGGLGWPGFTTLATSPGGARFFGPAPQAVERVLAMRPSLRRLTVPAGTFRGQDSAIETVGSWSLVLARPGLDPAVAYRLAKATADAGDAMAHRHPQGQEIDPRNLVSTVPADALNPGSVRYLREVGAIR